MRRMNNNMTWKEKLWYVTLIIAAIGVCALIVVLSEILADYERMAERVDTIDYNVNSLIQSKEKEKPDVIDTGMYVMEDLEDAVPGLEVEMIVTTPNNKYDFNKLEVSCDKLVSDNRLFFENNLCPYVSPGVRYEIRLRCNKDCNQYILLETVNTGNEDTCATNNEVFRVSFNNTEGYGIGGIMIGDNMEDVIERVGQPSAFSISEYGKISGAMYDYDDFRVSVIADIFRGEVECIEVERKVTGSYWNGE